jgi:hypothetical protein
LKALAYFTKIDGIYQELWIYKEQLEFFFGTEEVLTLSIFLSRPQILLPSCGRFPPSSVFRPTLSRLQSEELFSGSELSNKEHERTNTAKLSFAITVVKNKIKPRL